MQQPLELVFVPKRFLALSIAVPQVPEEIQAFADSAPLVKKAPVHISIMVTRNAHLLWGALARTPDEQVAMTELEALFRSYSWEYELTNEYYLHERDYTAEDMANDGYPEVPECRIRSIIQVATLPALTPFYNAVNEKFGLSLEVPIPHVTLYTWTNGPLVGRGIGINSRDEFERATKQRWIVG